MLKNLLIPQVYGRDPNKKWRSISLNKYFCFLHLFAQFPRARLIPNHIYLTANLISCSNHQPLHYFHRKHNQLLAGNHCLTSHSIDPISHKLYKPLSPKFLLIVKVLSLEGARKVKCPSQAQFQQSYKSLKSDQSIKSRCKASFI